MAELMRFEIKLVVTCFSDLCIQDTPSAGKINKMGNKPLERPKCGASSDSMLGNRAIIE